MSKRRMTRARNRDARRVAQARGGFWNLAADAESGNPADGVLDIDGEIVAEKGWFTPDGACVARDFRAALATCRNVTVRINSPGGDVMAGAEIYSALREHSMNGRGRVKVIVTALAASAASVIAMAGDEILMSPTAYMMIHNPWTMAAGDAKEMRKAAKTLDVITEGLINAYQIRTGKSRDELKRMLEAETWMSAATCVAEGFADGVIGMEGAAAQWLPAVRMSAAKHGAMEIAARIRGEETEDPEEPEEPEESENPDEEDGEDPERSENGEDDPDADPDADPDEPEENPENPNDPEEPDEDPEDEDDPEDPEDPEEEETPEGLAAAMRRVQQRATITAAGRKQLESSERKRREAIAARAAAIAAAAELAGW